MLQLILLLNLLSADPRLEALWRDGKDYGAFHQAAQARRELWDRNTGQAATIPDELLTRARAVQGNWRFLVVAVDRCSDSASTIPYLAAFADAAKFELRIISPDDGRFLMERHRTPDGRAATPTVILLNDRFDEAGAWSERPSELQSYMIENRGRMRSSELYDYEMDWYAKDAGRSTLREIVELLEKAAARIE